MPLSIRLNSFLERNNDSGDDLWQIQVSHQFCYIFMKIHFVQTYPLPIINAEFKSKLLNGCLVPSKPIFTAFIPRMGKVLLSQVCPQGCPCSLVPGLWSQILSREGGTPGLWSQVPFWGRGTHVLVLAGGREEFLNYSISKTWVLCKIIMTNNSEGLLKYVQRNKEYMKNKLIQFVLLWKGRLQIEKTDLIGL